VGKRDTYHERMTFYLPHAFRRTVVSREMQEQEGSPKRANRRG
jgi:hypothetical protein